MNLPPDSLLSAVPEPALVVLVGAAGSGKSTWAARHFSPNTVVSSDALRAMAGSGPGDLDASADAFDLVDRLVAARLRRRLTVVVDTLGLDVAARQAYLAAGRGAGLPCIAVHLTAPAAVCRARNAARDRPVPAPALRSQLSRSAAAADALRAEGWDAVLTVDTAEVADPARAQPDPASPGRTAHPGATGDDPSAVAPAGAGKPGIAPENWPPRPGDGRIDYVLNLSAFPWGTDPAGWLREMAQAADQAGFAGLALMDHLLQIPQVGRAWDPIPEPYVTLGLLAGLDLRLRLGTLVSPVTLRAPGILAKTLATLDVLSDGRAFCGMGAGWWEREHAAYGLDFPPPGRRLDLVEDAIDIMRALWSPGTKPYASGRVELPETTCYPRPVHDIPIILGGQGERTLRIASAKADAVNLPSTGEGLPDHLRRVRRACEKTGRDPASLAISVLDVTVTGPHPQEVARHVEAQRGRVAASTWSARHHAATVDGQRRRRDALAAQGVGVVFLAIPGLRDPDRLTPWASLTR